MLRKFLAMTFLLMMLAANCSAAINFQEPVEIGSVSTAGGDGIKISGATDINATTDNRGNYIAGTATFGKLYLHFDAIELAQKAQAAISSADMKKIYNEVSFFGSSDVENSVPYFVFEGLTKIYRIDNNAGLSLYLLATETGGGGSMTVIGERGGKWVKYFNTREGKKKFGIAPNFYLTDFYTDGDEIIFSYSPDNTNFHELHYRWDSATQRFAVEKI